MAIVEVSPMGTLLTWIAKNWKVILALIGIATAGVTAGIVVQTVSQVQPALAQALQITVYAIPVAVYSLVLTFVFQLISQIREMFK